MLVPLEDHHTVGIDIQGISFHIDIRTYPDLSTSAIAYARNLIKRTAFGFYYISYFQKHIGRCTKILFTLTNPDWHLWPKEDL